VYVHGIQWNKGREYSKIVKAREGEMRQASTPLQIIPFPMVGQGRGEVERVDFEWAKCVVWPKSGSVHWWVVGMLWSYALHKLSISLHKLSISRPESLDS
jgi:hypothetical protein